MKYQKDVNTWNQIKWSIGSYLDYFRAYLMPNLNIF